MNCEVTAFLNEHLFDLTDEPLWQQAVDSASYPGVKAVYLMPDTHLGYGIPVGGVVVTDDTIIQSGSGYDISCGVLYMKVPGLTAEAIATKEIRKQWIDAVEARIATGVGAARAHKAPPIRKISEILRYGARALGVPAAKCERHYIPVGDDFDDNLIAKALGTAQEQLGSVGGGNHFVELQVDTEGEVWIMIHCGSRGYGYQVADHFFHEGGKLRGLALNQREKSYLHVDEPLGKLYWQHHNAAANYAIANRHQIVHGITEATEEVLKHTPKVYYEISHNMVQHETLPLPDGTITKGFVHRKGSTRAMPSNHPDLVGTPWEHTGHPCCIPGSMFTGAAILFAGPNAHASACSVNHGSGRVLGRNEAKRQLTSIQELIDEQMNTVERDFNGTKIIGIVSNHKHTPIDECHECYKDLDEVLQILEQEQIAIVSKRLYPVANIKGK